MLFTEMPVLDHPDAILRPLYPDDVLAWYDYLTLPQVFEHTSWNVQAQSELEHYAWPPEQFTEASALRQTRQRSPARDHRLSYRCLGQCQRGNGV
ncbi:hypothetical protein [Chromobacterium piscinae]|uniref:hypothetical protein n=1 Tax=Chromobacterium piscinae TaxID=686831 RepID=UPI001E601B34|nr:hypothetical protein [Chromobacterium piscinae]MCD5327473.1 hypothetical protein [Chromobacterium piscinae]